MKRTFVAFGLAALVACSKKDSAAPAAAAPGASPQARQRVVGVSLLTKTHPFYKSLEEGLRGAAAKEGLEVKVQSAEFDTATQTSQVENFLAQKVDAIVICPVDSQAIGGAIQRANAARVPVFTADIRSLQGEVVSHIASDNVQGGTLVGDYLAKRLGGKGKVAILEQPEVSSAQDRVQGFERALGAHAGIQVVAKLSGGGVRDQAATTMENILQAHPDLNAVFGINDSTALGVLSVLEARGKKDILVVGFDADAEAREAIRKGRLLADAAQDPVRLGEETARTVAKHLRGESVEKVIAIPTSIVDRAALEGQ